MEIYAQITKAIGNLPNTFVIGGHGIAVLKPILRADTAPAASSASPKDDLSA
jgi:hypothetical protein